MGEGGRGFGGGKKIKKKNLKRPKIFQDLHNLSTEKGKENTKNYRYNKILAKPKGN